MSTEHELSFQQRSLFQQGYQRFSPKELRQLEWGLRFTPTVCSLITLVALIYGSSTLLFIVAGLGIWAFFFPAGHPMDFIYNYGVRFLFGAVKLPENPFQRRLACLAAGIMNVIAATLLLANLPYWAWVVGGMLLALQAIVIFTHFCTLSWMYEGVMRLFGKWHKPVEIGLAKNLLSQGAILVDVRSRNEFADDAVPGAINMPLEELDGLVEQFKQGVCLLYCNSGTRSHIAHQKLNAIGLEKIYNLGALHRAQEISA